MRGRDRGRWIGRADRPHSAQLSALELPESALFLHLSLPIAFCQCSHPPKNLPALRPLGLEGAVFCPPSALRDGETENACACLALVDVLRRLPVSLLDTTDRHVLLASVCFCEVPTVSVVYMLACSEQPRRSNNNNDIVVSRACRESGSSSSHHEHEHEHEHEPPQSLIWLRALPADASEFVVFFRLSRARSFRSSALVGRSLARPPASASASASHQSVFRVLECSAGRQSV